MAPVAEKGSRLFGKKRIFLTLSAILVCGFLATSSISYFVARASLSQEISQISLPLSSESIYFEMKLALAKPIQISRAMAQNTFLRDWAVGGEENIADVEQYLALIQQKNQTFSSFFISEATKRYYHPSGKVRFVSEDDPSEQWYRDARAMSDEFAVVVDEDEMRDGQLAIFVNHRVLDREDNFIGVTGVGIEFNTAQELLEKTAARYRRTLYFVNAKGHVVLSGRDYTGPRSIRRSEGLADHAETILSSDDHSFAYKHDGDTTFVNSRFIEDVGWWLIVKQKTKPVYAPIYQTLLSNMAAALLLTAVVVFLIHLTIRRYQGRLETLATRDSLTGALNRHAFDVILEQTIVEAKRRKDETFTVAILDIDHFKQVNDTHGHLAGDAVLKGVAETAVATIRESDVFCRWGGEEFIILLQNCDITAAQRLVESIRNKIAAHTVDYKGANLQITMSAGLAEFENDMDSDALIRKADDMLYKAKAAGRDRMMPQDKAA